MKPRKALPRLKARLCRTRSHHAPRAASRDVPSVSVHRAIARRQQFEHDYLRHCSVSFSRLHAVQAPPTVLSAPPTVPCQAQACRRLR